jgi:hypothetical protein
MSEINPFMMIMLEQNNFVGAAEEVQNNMSPLPEQQTFGEGSIAILASANTALEGDFTIARGLDPADHEETFPDWEERVLLRDHVLVELFSRQDPEFSIGWVHRLKLLPVKKYRYRELKQWRRKGFPDEPPEWVLKIYRDYTDRLSEQAPGQVPVAVTCPRCHKRNVELVVTRTLKWTGRAGLMEVNGLKRHLPVNDVSNSSEHVAQLICKDCKLVGDLTDDEWILPDISN